MRQEKLVCERCGSSIIVKDSVLKYAVVQEIDRKTKKPIGNPITKYAFKCLACGKEIYISKFEAATTGYFN